MSAGVLYFAAAKQSRAWLAITMPSRDLIFAWDHVRARCLPVEERLQVALHIGDPDALNAPPLSRTEGWLCIDVQDRLSLRVDASPSLARHPQASIAADAALVSAIALTYPRECVVIRSLRAWSVVYRARSAA